MHCFLSHNKTDFVVTSNKWLVDTCWSTKKECRTATESALNMSCCQKSILNLVSNQLRFWFTVLHTKEKRYPKKKWRTPSISSLIYWLAENSSFCALLHHADLAIFNWNNANKAQFDGSFSLSISAPLKLRKLWDVSGPKAHSHIDDDDKQYENDTSDLQQIMCRGVVFFFSFIFLSLSHSLALAQFHLVDFGLIFNKLLCWTNKTECHMINRQLI